MIEAKLLLFFVLTLILSRSKGLKYTTESCSRTSATTFENVCEFKPNLIVTPSNGEKIDESNCNILVAKSTFAEQPQVKLNDVESDNYYTLIMVDPDAPNHGNGKFFLHWIANNIQGSQLKEGNINQSYDVVSYRKPSPPKGTGDHRYMFLIYEQPGGKGPALKTSNRPLFDLDEYLKEQDVAVCGPIAAAQFKAHF